MTTFKCQPKIAAIGIVCAMTAVVAYGKDSMVGVWSGQVAGKTNRPVSVTLNIEQDDSLGQAAGSIEYGLPWQCSLNLQYDGERESNGAKVFSLSIPLIAAAPGPHCQVLIGGFVSVLTTDSGTLSTLVVTRYNDVKDKTTLTRRP
ncbi:MULTISPECIES: hypothetical protein [Methylomonas]|uniref:hypothetical protein n=1 Tax=Methylomonas TaxID=416 RepID=UPI00123299AC|nr:hypothetical protein [Methylomonas rhizoryzae]